jgi:hypothetical protein
MTTSAIQKVASALVMLLLVAAVGCTTTWPWPFTSDDSDLIVESEMDADGELMAEAEVMDTAASMPAEDEHEHAAEAPVEAEVVDAAASMPAEVDEAPDDVAQIDIAPPAPVWTLDLQPIEPNFEPVGELHSSLTWLIRDKVRAIWISSNLYDTYPGSDKTIGQALADAGFNLICLNMAVDEGDASSSADLEQRLPANVEEAQRVGLKLVVAWQYGSDHAGQYRRYRAPTGPLAQQSSCPRDVPYVRRHVSYWAEAAAAAGADGFLLNTAMYESDAPSYPGSCVCDICFASYLKRFASDQWRAVHEGVEPRSRGDWLRQNGAMVHYDQFMASLIESQYDGTRKRCQTISPAFFFATAPGLGHLPGLERGLGTSSVPCLIFSQKEYVAGPLPVTHAAVDRIKRENIPALYLPGLWLLKQTPTDLASHAVTASVYADGWWCWNGDALLSRTGVGDEQAFSEPHGRFPGTSAADYLAQIADVNHRFDRAPVVVPRAAAVQQPQTGDRQPKVAVTPVTVAQPQVGAKDGHEQVAVAAPVTATVRRPAGPRMARVRWRTDKIKIDGRINEAAWSNATLSNMAVSSFGERVEPVNTIWMCWDRKALYLAIRCPIPKGSELKVAELGSDLSTLRQGDGIDVLLDPSPSSRDYAHLMVSAIGQISDSMMTRIDHGDSQAVEIDEDPYWDSQAQVATVRQARAYVIEMRIPFESFGSSPEAGSIWAANFFRQQPTQQVWSPTFGANQSPARFGKLLFLKKK